MSSKGKPTETAEQQLPSVGRGRGEQLQVGTEGLLGAGECSRTELWGWLHNSVNALKSLNCTPKIREVYGM